MRINRFTPEQGATWNKPSRSGAVGTDKQTWTATGTAAPVCHFFFEFPPNMSATLQPSG